MNYRSDSQNKNIRVSTCGKFRVIRIPYGVNWIYSAEYLHKTPTKAGHMAQSWKKVHNPVPSFEKAKQQIEEHKLLMGVKYAE